MYPTTMNFAKVNEVPIVIIYTKFGEDRSISLVSAGSRISPLCLHLTTSHYNIACTTVQLVICYHYSGLAIVRLKCYSRIWEGALYHAPLPTNPLNFYALAI